MKQPVSVWLAVLVCGAVGYWAGQRDPVPASAPRNRQVIEQLLDASIPFSQLSDEELAATCEVNATPCAQLVQKMAALDAQDAEAMETLVGARTADGLCGDYGYNLADGRTLYVERCTDLDLLEEYSPAVPETPQPQPFVRIRYPDGRTLQFASTGDLLQIAPASTSSCQVNGWPCVAVVRELNNPHRRVTDRELLGTQQPPVCGIGGDKTGWIYQLPDGTRLLHQTQKAFLDTQDTRGFVALLFPQKGLSYFTKEGYAYDTDFSGEWVRLAYPALQDAPAPQAD